jgi:hypothetical protein
MLRQPFMLLTEGEQPPEEFFFSADRIVDEATAIVATVLGEASDIASTILSESRYCNKRDRQEFINHFWKLAMDTGRRLSEMAIFDVCKTNRVDCDLCAVEREALEYLLPLVAAYQAFRHRWEKTLSAMAIPPAREVAQGPWNGLQILSSVEEVTALRTRLTECLALRREGRLFASP